MNWIKKILSFNQEEKPDNTVLETEQATAQATGVRQAWIETSIARTINPESLATLIQDAGKGDTEKYLILAEEMEERDPHYAGVLSTRKRSVSGLEYQVMSPSDDEKDIEITDAVRKLTTAPQFTAMLENCLDGLGKGYAVVEIIWESTAKEWRPKEYKWRPQRWFKYDELTGRELLLINPDGITTTELPLYKYIIHEPQLKSGLPIRGGLARLVAVSYMCKAYTLTNWTAFLEVFGLPLRLGKYGKEATKEDIAALRRAVQQIGTDTGAIIPESMQIEFISAIQQTNADKLFEGLQRWLDEQISKAVLGQTMTSDNGSSQSQATVHNEVRLDIVKADAGQLSDTINRDLIRPYVILNYGEQEEYPTFKLHQQEKEDIATMVNALEKLVPLGLEIEQAGVVDRLGFPTAPEGAKLLAIPQPQQGLATNTTTAKMLALNQELTDPVEEQLPPNTIEVLTEAELENWEEVQTPMRNAIDALIAEEIANNGTLTSLQKRIEELTKRFDKPGGYTDTLADDLGIANFKGRTEGDNEANEEKGKYSEEELTEDTRETEE